MSSALRLVCLLVGAFISLFAVPAAAESPQELFAKGQELFEDKKFDEALPYFQNAFDATKSPNASLYVARCLEKMGKLDDAYQEMQRTVEIATEQAASDEKYASTRDAAAGELAQLKARVGLLVIAFTESFPDATVTVNERQLSAEEVGVPFPVMPGIVTIVGSATGREPVTKTEEVGAGETKTVALALPEAKLEPDTPPDEGGFELTTMRIAGFAVAGVGVVGMVVFAITGSMASSKFSQLEEECVSRCTDLAYADTIDSGKTLSTVANVSVALGGAALVAGGLLVLLGGPDEEESTPEAGEARLTSSPGGLGIVVSF